MKQQILKSVEPWKTARAYSKTERLNLINQGIDWEKQPKYGFNAWLFSLLSGIDVSYKKWKDCIPIMMYHWQFTIYTY